MRRRTMTILVAAAAAVATAWRRLGPDVDADAGVLNPRQVARLYDRLAPNYDLFVGAYRLLGSRRLTRPGIAALQLQPGDTVIDLGCGTGTLLPALADEVSPGGRVIGVDLSPRMLARARRRVAGRTDVDVELVEGDVREFDWPDRTDAVIATYALEMVPDYDQVIADAATALAPRQGRIAVSGLRAPRHWPSWAVRAGIALTRPFGVHEDYLTFHPWEAIRTHTTEIDHRTTGAGALYLSVGQAH